MIGIVGHLPSASRPSLKFPAIHQLIGIQETVFSPTSVVKKLYSLTVFKYREHIKD